MPSLETAKLYKDNVCLTEYLDQVPEKYFIQVGIAGIHATKQELVNLYNILNYYINIDNFSECTIKIGEDYVSIR